MTTIYAPRNHRFADAVLAIARTLTQPSTDPAFIDALVEACRATFIPAWLYGRTGVMPGVLAFPNPSGARDISGQMHGLEIIRVVDADGLLVWEDITEATMADGVDGCALLARNATTEDPTLQTSAPQEPEPSMPSDDEPAIDDEFLEDA